MNKVFFISLLTITFIINSYSQTFKIGVKGGINYANLTDTTIKTDAITSYHAGLVSEICLFNSFSLQPELLYSTQGASYKNAIEEFKNELGYISIPVLAKIYLNKSISLELGPQASFLLNKKDEFNLNDYNSVDFSLNGGIGIKITKSLFLQARYNLGLNEISKNAEAKNSVFQLSAGILF